MPRQRRELAGLTAYVLDRPAALAWRAAIRDLARP
jgi:hypothetical protein